MCYSSQIQTFSPTKHPLKYISVRFFMGYFFEKRHRFAQGSGPGTFRSNAACGSRTLNLEETRCYTSQKKLWSELRGLDGRMSCYNHSCVQLYWHELLNRDLFLQTRQYVLLIFYRSFQNESMSARRRKYEQSLPLAGKLRGGGSGQNAIAPAAF